MNTPIHEDSSCGWGPALVAEVVRIADGYPYLQLYADALWRVARPAEDATVAIDALDRARRLVTDELDTMFRARWSSFAAFVRVESAG